PPRTGERTTFWCVNAWEDVRGDHTTHIAVSPFTAEEDGGRVAKWAERWSVDVYAAERDWAAKARALKPKPSTGLLFLLACHELRVPVVAFGFDGLERGHHWDEHHKHDHPPEAEALRALTSIAFVR